MNVVRTEAESESKRLKQTEQREVSNANHWNKPDADTEEKRRKLKGTGLGTTDSEQRGLPEWCLEPRGQNLVGNRSLEILERKKTTESPAQGTREWRWLVMLGRKGCEDRATLIPAQAKEGTPSTVSSGSRSSDGEAVG